MKRMCQSANYLLLLCFFATGRVTGHMSPPPQSSPQQSFSIDWTDEFKPVLTWEPPTSATNCTYEVYHQERFTKVTTPYWSRYTWMEGGSLDFKVTADCNGTSSEQNYSVNYPVVVENLTCYLSSSTNYHCSWKSTNPTLGFYYKGLELNLQECPSYSVTEGVRTGCDLQANLRNDIQILFNGTMDDKPFRNTYHKIINDVRLPALNWNVVKSGNKFIITWTLPDTSLSGISYRIQYTECGEMKQKTVPEQNTTSYELDLLPYCPYSIKMRAEGRALMMDWTIAKNFDTSLDLRVYAVIIIPPLVVALIALLVFQYCRKNKEHIFPKVPKPKDLLSDISNNNNKNSVCNLYMPMREDETCKITMVIDPQTTKGTADKSMHW